MFLPFLAAATVATAFAQLGAMSVQIAVLTGAFLAAARLLLMRTSGLERPVRKVECRLSVFWSRSHFPKADRQI